MNELYAMEHGFLSRFLFAIENIPPEQAEQARAAFSESEQPSILANTGNGEATVRITGPLSPKGPGFIEQFLGFGGTSYDEIAKVLDEIKSDPTVSTVRLAMDTPGGQVSGMNKAREAIASLAESKEVIAENHGMIASAGYFLASAAHKIVALSPFAKTGSIGVVVAGIDPTGAMDKAGIKRVRIVSSNAPKKQPDVTTEDGKSIIQEEIDATERVFIKSIAEGRGVTPDYVIENFGKGAMLIAEDPDQTKPSALKSGLIDSVVTAQGQTDSTNVGQGESSIETVQVSKSNEQKTNSAERGNFNHQEDTVMDLNTLKAEHPALYEQAVEAGVQQERERVSAHLTMAEASGDHEFATKCINEGTGFTANVNATYMASGMKNSHIGARADEKAPDVTTPDEEAENTSEDEVAALLSAKLGVEAQDNG